MNFGVKSIYFLNTSLPFFSSASSSVLTTLHPVDSGTNQACYPRLKPGDLHAALSHSEITALVSEAHTQKKPKPTKSVPGSAAQTGSPVPGLLERGPTALTPPAPQGRAPSVLPAQISSCRSAVCCLLFQPFLKAFAVLCGWDLGMGGSWAGHEGGQGTGEIASGSGSGSGSGSCSQPGAWRPREPQPPQGSRERAMGVHK